MEALEKSPVAVSRVAQEAPVHETRSDIRVRYAETDQMGKAHHMQYLAWFELARMELLRANGVSYAELERNGVMLPVTLVEVEYRQSVGYDDEVHVWASLGEVRSRTVEFSYEVRRAVDDGLLARGRTVLACTDSNGRARSLPGSITRALFGRAEPSRGMRKSVREAWRS